MSLEGQAAHFESIGYAPYWTSLPDPRKMAKEPWWKAPTELYIQPAEAEKDLKRLNDEWKQIFKVQ